MAAVTAPAFDTLATARKLKAAGVDDAQAEAHAEAIASAVHSGRDDLATRADLAAVKTDLASVKTDLAGVKVELAAVKADVRDVKAGIDGLKGKIDGAKWDLGLFLGFLSALGIAMAARLFGAF